MKKILFVTAFLALLFPSVLSALHHKETEKTQKAEVIVDRAEIFLEASQHSIVIDTISRGTTVTLFPSGKKNKKWLYISYHSKKRGSQVTGFVDSNRVEIIKEDPADEPESPEYTTEPLSEEGESVPEEKNWRDTEKELEELRILLNEMEREKQERQPQEVEDQNQEEVVQQEHSEEEQEVLNAEAETKKEKNKETSELREQETRESQESGAEENRSQDAAKQEKVDTHEDGAQEQEETEEEEQAPLAQEEVLADEEATAEQARETEVEELPKVLTKVTVKVPRANIRLMPTTQSSIIHQVRSGVELKHMAKTGNWHRVNLAPNKEGIVLSGYIHKNIVNEVYETIAPPPMPEKSPETEPDVVEEEAKFEPEPEPEPVRKIQTFQKSTLVKYYWAGGGAGYTMPSESHFGKGINFGGTFGFGVMKHLAIELRVPYFQSDVIGTNDGLSSGRLSSLSLMLSIQGRYPIKNRFVPYLVAGGDYHLNTFSLNDEITNFWNNQGFDIRESVDHTFGFHFGTGLDVFLVENIALNVDARYYTANMTGKRTLANQISQETTSGKIDNMKLNSLQVGISVKLFLNPLTRK
ncbi:MAG: outer membrane beta-barrel protein [Candidatus Aminicenantes bacterium]|nr:MAG: outer membrane beta-barrel protein [Candidatus Aminicenantes bacterium]